MNTIDGAASYLGMDTRRNLTEDFRSATMEWESDLTWQLPARELDQLKRDENYVRLTEQIFTYTTLISRGGSTEELEQHTAYRKQAYDDRRKFMRRKLQEYQRFATD